MGSDKPFTMLTKRPEDYLTPLQESLITGGIAVYRTMNEVFESHGRAIAGSGVVADLIYYTVHYCSDLGWWGPLRWKEVGERGVIRFTGCFKDEWPDPRYTSDKWYFSAALVCEEIGFVAKESKGLYCVCAPMMDYLDRVVIKQNAILDAALARGGGYPYRWEEDEE